MGDSGGDGVRAREIATEQRYVDRVYTRVGELRGEARALAAEGHGRATLGKHIFSALFERDALVYQAARRARELDAAHEGLVFGRLDLDDGDTRYIGRIGLRDADLEPMVVDWRAPAAAPFYRATARDRWGVIRRRVIDCRRERVVGVDDDLLAPELAGDSVAVVGDGALMAALSRSRRGGMRDIVATIQAEQDEIVRAPSNGATMITGGPGTGKTAVALHRAAYLLYQERRRFERGGVLIVGPSNAFIRFIERVLPSLGESSATLTSLGDLVGGMETDRFDTPRIAMLKGSLRMLTILRAAATMPTPGIPSEFRTTWRGVVLRLPSERLTGVRRTVLRREHRPNVARSGAERALVSALWQAYAGDSASPAPAENADPAGACAEDSGRTGDETGGLAADDAGESAEGETGETAGGDTDADAGGGYAEFADGMRERGEVADFLDEWWPVLDPRAALSLLGDPERLATAAGGSLAAEDIKAIAESFRRPDPSVADVALVEELADLLGRAVPRRQGSEEDAEDSALALIDAEPASTPVEISVEEYAHIVVDEAQDLSPMQWRALGRRGRRASWTIVGDALQSSWADSGEAEAAMGTALRRNARRQYRLDVNYRNPEEIFDLAASVVREGDPAAELPRAVRRTGHLPEHVASTAARLGADVRAAGAAMLGHVDGDVAVIVAEAQLAAAREWAPADPRLTVVHAIAAKGLEFDGVVVVEPTLIGRDVARTDHLLYVVLTRATQRLVTVSTDPAWRHRIAAGSAPGGF